MKDVFSMSCRAIRIWLHLENWSIKNNIKWPIVLSTNMSMCGREKSSLGLALLRSQKSTQNLTLPFFLGTRTTLVNYAGYSTIDKNPTLSCFWISSFTCKLQRWCNRLNFYLTDLTWSRSDKWCWIMDGWMIRPQLVYLWFSAQTGVINKIYKPNSPYTRVA